MTTGYIYFTWLDPSDHLVILLPPAGLGALEVASHQLQLLVAADLRHLEADNSPGQEPLQVLGTTFFKELTKSEFADTTEGPGTDQDARYSDD